MSTPILQILPNRYRTRRFKTFLPSLIACSSLGEIDYRCVEIRDLHWQPSEGFVDVGLARFNLRWAGETFLLVLDGPETRIEGPHPDLAASEYEGIGGHLLGHFLEQMGIDETHFEEGSNGLLH